MNSFMPKVTVYITTYNRLNLLKRAVESVQNQSYSNIEIIVADDGSHDGSHEYLLQMQSDNLLKAVINTGASNGACFGRNRAIELATGDYITGLDDDDYFEPFRIENFITYWKQIENQSGVAGLYDSVIELRPDGDFKHNETLQADYQSLRKHNSVGNQIFVCTSHLKAISGFDEKMPALQDWDTWIRLTQRFGKLVNINSHSYVIDQIHGGERISSKKAVRVRTAFERLSTKLQPVSFSERLGLLESMYSYKQMNIVYSELFFLLLGCRLRKIAQVLKRHFIHE